MGVAERKALLRAAERSRWDESPELEERAKAGRVIQERFLETFPPERGRRVALYASVRGEVATGLIRAACLAAGAVPWYPRAMEDGSLLFFPHGERDGWVIGRFGVPEPERNGGPGARAGFDLVVVPGLAYDRRGRRLGQGHGYYDRFLSGLNRSAPTVGLAFSWQIVPEVPVDSWDLPVDAIVTEEDVLWTRGARLREPVR